MVDVCFLLPGLVQAGGVRAVLSIANELQSAGRDVAVAVPRRSLLPHGKGVRALLARSAPRRAAPLAERLSTPREVGLTWFDLRAALVIAETPAFRHLPDAKAMIATSWRTAEEVERAGLASTRGVYFIQHLETWSGRKSRVDATWRAFDRVVVTADWLRERAEGFGKEGVELAVYGVDLRTFTPSSEPVAKPVPVIGFMHDDREWKGGADVLAALERVRAGREVQVRSFGLGARPLPSWVESVGRLSGDDLASFYRSLDVFISGSWTESGPMTLPEAMGCAVPVVSTDVGNASLWSDGGRAIALTEPKDPSGLADAVERLLDDPAAAREMGERGHRVIQDYGWERTARDFDSALVAFGLLEAR